GYEPAGVGGRRHFPGIADFEADRVRCQPRALQVCMCGVDGAGIQVVADDGAFQLRGNMGTRLVLDIAPVAGIVVAQPLESERPPDSRRYAQRYPGRFDKYGAAAAERVQQSLGRIPARQGQPAGGEVLTQGRFTLLQAPAPLEEGLAGCVQIRRRAVFVQKQVDARIGPDCIDAGPFAFEIAQTVANAIFGAQIAILQALHGAAYGRGIDPQGLLGAEPTFPWRVLRQLQDVVFVADRAMGDLDQYAGGQPRIEVGP